ncbi:pleckstrin homology domain-containing family G member 4B-like isoform X2 [Anguilla rostrata]|uniref:pleckstrin homology domain-containing family G member 4B-like isoform X2 n=1 Tax=Anguilla rostrata TaxID=7938 RepID=UPI0030CCF5DC
MVSMGIGNKPFMDIKPSDAAISDRAIDYIMKGSVTEGSETSSQCTSSDSMTGLNGLTIPSTIAMETFSNDGAPFLCASSSSSSPPQVTSPAPFQKEQDLQSQNNKFITAL